MNYKGIITIESGKRGGQLERVGCPQRVHGEQPFGARTQGLARQHFRPRSGERRQQVAGLALTGRCEIVLAGAPHERGHALGSRRL